MQSCAADVRCADKVQTTCQTTCRPPGAADEVAENECGRGHVVVVEDMSSALKSGEISHSNVICASSVGRFGETSNPKKVSS